ncbi:MAG TPA: PEP/pyruvate-binding domain-containing protein [Chloroflexota bacterium]|nr:PEP/pyruvate-binding domain-containing protein [Chloroflexota bacterium]
MTTPLAEAPEEAVGARDVLWLEGGHAFAAEVVGGKAAPLARMAADGVRVPAGFVVPANAYRALVEPLRGRIEALLGELGSDATGAEGVAQQIRELVLGVPVDTGVEAALRRAVGDLLTRDVGSNGAARLLAVRSSATVEDLPGASFAGQYDTYLGIQDVDSAVEAVRKCWASYWSARAIAYRAQKQIDHWPGAMAVLVMRLVPADVAGVAFTAHPTVGWRYLLTVNAALGLGEGVVDGSVPADTYAIDKDLRQIVLRDVKAKTQRVVAQDGATAREVVEKETAEKPALSDAQLLELLDVTCAIERRAGAPQDVEWAYAGGDLYVLQARPITALPADPLATFEITWDDPKERARHWRLASLPGEPAKGRPHKPISADMVAFEARSWMNGLFLTGRPKRPVTKAVGIYRYWSEVDSFPSEEAAKTVQREFEARVERYRAAGRCMYPDEQQAELEATNEKLYRFDRERATDAELAHHLEEAGRVVVRHWTLHWYWWFGDWQASGDEAKTEGRWNKLYRELTGDARKGAAKRLITGLENRLTRAIDRVMTLAQIAQRSPALRTALEGQTAAEFLAAVERGELPGSRAFRAEWARLMEEQPLRTGQGAGADTNPLTPPWIAAPELVLELVRRYLPRDITRLRRVRAAAERRRVQRVETARRLVGSSRKKRAQFDRAYAAACASARWFEDHNYLIDSATQGLHYLALTAAARRLIERGVLERVEDVLWLRLEELTGRLRAEEKEPLQPLVAERKQEHERWRALTPPLWLGAPPPPERLKSDEQKAKEEKEQAARDKRLGADKERVLVQGQSGSPGVATGRVRIIPTETPVPDVKQGEVLVARMAGPLWTPVFPALAGIVLQQGAIFQHDMVTAREYRVPAVFQAKDCLKLLQEGQLVTVDGTRGVVLRAEEPAATDGRLVEASRG